MMGRDYTAIVRIGKKMMDEKPETGWIEGIGGGTSKVLLLTFCPKGIMFFVSICIINSW